MLRPLLALVPLLAVGLAVPPALAAADIPATTSLAVGSGPSGVAVAPDGSVWVTNFDSDTVSVVSGGVVVDTVDVGDGPLGIAIDPVRDLAYVTNYFDGTLSVITRTTGTETSIAEVGNFPVGVDVTPTGTRIVVANLGTDSVSVLSGGDLAELAVVPVGVGPWGVAVTGTVAAITNSGDGTVTVLPLASLSPNPAIAVGTNPTGVVIDAAGTSAFVTDTAAGTVARIDLATGGVTTSAPALDQPLGIAVAANEHALYVTESHDSTLALVDPDTLTVLPLSVSVGQQPRGVAVGDDAATAYVTDFGSDSLTTLTWSAPPEPPGPPTGASAVAGPRSATVTWTAPTDAGTSPITRYTVRASASASTCSVPSGGALSCVVTGLTPGIAQTFTVTAVNAVGESDPSAPSNTVTPEPGPAPQPTPPAAPTAVTAIAGIEAADINWTPPADPGSSPLQYYVVTADPGGDTCRAAASTRPTCTVEGLTPEVPVRFTVVAYNATSASAPSDPSAAVTPQVHPGAPSPPRDIAAAQGTGSSIDVTWLAPEDDGHTPIIGYEAFARPVTGGPDATCEPGVALSCTITGVTPGVRYVVTVTASNAQGTSLMSDPSEPVYIRQRAAVAHVSARIAPQTYQQVLLVPGAPAARLISQSTTTCLVQGGRAVFIAEGPCRLLVRQKGRDPITVTTRVSGTSTGTATPLSVQATITFAADSAALTKPMRRALQATVPALRSAGTVTVAASAPTLALARQRAQAIEAFLVRRSVTVTAITAGTGAETGIVRSAPAITTTGGSRR